LLLIILIKIKIVHPFKIEADFYQTEFSSTSF
jgi:hypothetical protein